MSQNHRKNGRTHARHPRPSSNSNRSRLSGDDQALARLGYKKGHLTDQELTLFGELRYVLTDAERHELARVAKTLRRPFKRLRALDLMRYWGMPLTRAQQRMLPWFAGLTWQRSLPSGRPVDAVRLAQHLLCSLDVPPFLLEPFAHPERYAYADFPWELCRIAATLGSGGGLVQLRANHSFWTRVPPDVFERFLQTPNDTPIMEGLIGAFVQTWGGPPWLAKLAATWSNVRWFADNLATVLRVAYELCERQVTAEEAPRQAEVYFAEVPRYNRNFGRTKALPIANIMPGDLEAWTSVQLRTPKAFEDEEANNGAWIPYYFSDAQRGQLSFWSLRCQDRRITLEVDVPRMRVRQVAPYSRPADPEIRRVVTLWVQANGMTT